MPSELLNVTQFKVCPRIDTLDPDCNVFAVVRFEDVISGVFRTQLIESNVFQVHETSEDITLKSN